MTKDEALAMNLALEALKMCRGLIRNNIAEGVAIISPNPFFSADVDAAITAIKQVRALDKMAENARELGLDYEPVAPVQEDWGPGPHECHSLTVSVQEPVAWRYRGIFHEFDPSDWAEGPVTPLYATPPAAPVQEPVAHCEAGPNSCPQCHKESRPTYGSEEVRKLREVIESQAKIIESNKPPLWFNAVENILKEYGLQAIDFVADFKAAIVDAEQHAAQPAPVQEPVAWKWHQAPVKTQWGDDMVVADLAIDKDHTVSVYCERDQTAKVEAMLTPPAAQRQWVGLTDAEVMQTMSGDWTSQFYFARAIEAKLKELNT